MKKLFLVFTTIFMVFALTACSGKSITRQSYALDTVISITTDEKSRSRISEAFSLLNDYEKIFSRTNPESELYLLNNGSEKLSDDMEKVLSFSLEMSRITDGAFDITVAPLVDLWNIKERTVPPSEDEINSTLPLVGYGAVSVEQFSIENRKLDMGAVAKGYIADKIGEYLRSNDVKKAVIDLGGNVVLIGEYTVGIRNPFKPEEIFATITVKDKSAVTSGAYQRYFEYEGKRYHHIIDPRTGYPSQSAIASVTVISPSSMQADALSTSIFILGKDALSLCDKFPDTDAIIIMEDGSVITTENFEKKYNLKK